MTETEKKALALVGAAVSAEQMRILPTYVDKAVLCEALFRAIEQHEAFRQEVSDAIQTCMLGPVAGERLSPFIIAKPDPLVEAYNDALPETAAVHGKETVRHICAKISAALAARGLEIREKQP